ncbi:hypothetical protein ACFL6S_21080, partial [Candidatus Poribacteria bacterium]
AKVGDTLKLTVDVEGFDPGTPAQFDIFERGASGPDNFITTIETETESDKAEAEWEYEFTDDDDLREEEEEEKRQSYSAPEYYFVVKVEGRQARSDLLEFRDEVEISLTDEDDKPASEADYVMYLPSGEVRKGKLGKDGTKKIDNVPPKGCLVEFPGFSAFKEIK